MHVLAYFDKSKPSIIQSDQYKKGLGAGRLWDGKAVIYASRSLTETKQHYSSIESKPLSIVFSLK